ncbi:MAG: 3'-5' exonuclease [Helicobacteraceae bacterium]|nr:3'-5' exonuclease [Helicobacteraceae bacterium]
MLIFLDLETTGLEEKDRLCSIGIIAIDENEFIGFSELIKPQKKVTVEASSINHITNEMLKEKKVFNDSHALVLLNKYNKKENTLIAHNSNFDLEMLRREGFKWSGVIVDTLRCSKHLIQECERYSLQYLRYELKLYKQEVALAKELNIKIEAHSAISDAMHVNLLYDYLLEDSTSEELENLTFKQVLIQKFNFGKHNGKYIEEVATGDRAYLEWLLKNMSDLDEDLRYSVEYFLTR